jgi:hypothetical protein
MKCARFVLLIAILAGTACGDSIGAIGDLTETEATELAAAVFTTAFMSAAGAPEGPDPVAGPQMAPFAFTREVDFVTDCAIDGIVDVSAVLDVEGDTQSEAGRIEYELTLEHQGCTVASPNDIVFTLDGAPDVSVYILAENDGQGNIALEASLEGRVDWSAQGHDGGTCDMDFVVSGAVSESAQTIEFVAEGVICRFSINTSATVG